MSGRSMVFFVACALPLVLVRQLAPSMAHQLDFWLLWVLAMVSVGLPILFAEFALSARSGIAPWQGMQKLTREADAKMVWRVFAGLSVLVSLLTASSMMAYIGAGVESHIGVDSGISSMAVSAGLMVVVLIVSALKMRSLLLGVVISIIGALISLFDGGLYSQISVPVLTEISLAEWAKAVALALLSVGVGTGLYWFGGVQTITQIAQQKKSLTGFVLPVWLTQVIVGSFALLMGSAFVTPISFVVSSIGMILVAGFLLYYALTQLIGRFGTVNGLLTGGIGAILLSVLPQFILIKTLLFSSLVAVLVLAIFAGFAMKISHLRKALNFASEARYNIWRVLVRLGVPLAVLLALIGWIIAWITV